MDRAGANNFGAYKSMNKEQLHDEFNTKPLQWSLTIDESHIVREQIKSFYDKKIDEILQELVNEGGMADNYFQQSGYNLKRQEIVDKIKELGYE